MAGSGADKLVKTRKFKRTGLENVIAKIETELGQEKPSRRDLDRMMLTLEKTVLEIEELNTKIWDKLMNQDLDDSEYDEEVREVMSWTEKINSVRVDVNGALFSEVVHNSVPSEAGAGSHGNKNHNQYKLPKIQIKKFNGQYTEWLSWWSQFEKIHLNEELDPSDKFQYLVQSIEPGNRAYNIVSSYPITDGNYVEVIKVLKRRFGNKTMLVEISVRKLLSLIIESAQSKQKKPLSSLYDLIDSNLRALKTLGIDAENSAAFLYPLVESSIPPDIVQVWQRTNSSSSEESDDEDGWIKARLSKLMKFLEKEVEGAERLEFVKKGLSDPEKKIKSAPVEEPIEYTSTAAALVSGNRTEVPTNNRKPSLCVFCDGNHASHKCWKAQAMTAKERQRIVETKHLCFACLKPGHLSKSCPQPGKCDLCFRRHYAIVCPQVEQKNQNQAMLSSLNCSSEVIMQTMLVKIRNGHKELIVRAIMDTASQKSYILGKAVQQLGIQSIGKNNITHELFGGSNYTEAHDVYKIDVSSLDGNFRTQLQFLDTNTICSDVPKVQVSSFVHKLRAKNICITDLGSGCSEIQLLIGADQYGTLLTGQIEQLSNGLTAIETKLGWALIGKNDRDSQYNQFSLLSLAPVKVSQFRDLETIGIKDPIEKLSKVEEETQVMSQFQSKLSRGQDGRYSVGLPWNNDPKTVTSNLLVAEKRLLCTTKKLQDSKMYETYDKIFQDWENERIIEEVPVDDKSNCFYLPHRAVIKPESLTTPVRPVFDGTCKNSRNPSINDCLYKGPNLLEKIPIVLLQFREKQIGVTADIRKAFQMIDVNEDDRDFLRFLWWEKPGKLMKNYRHRRVVFGINSSPFLLAATINHHLGSVEDLDKNCANKLKNSLYVDNVTTSVSNYYEYQDFMSDATRIMADGLFELRQWDHTHFEPGVGSSDCGLGTDGQEYGPVDEVSTISVLGLKWNKFKDTLSCETGTEVLPQLINKRTILSSIHQVFDPLGILSPALIPPKLMLQQLWSISSDWDIEVPKEFQEQFKKWNSERSFLGLIEIPRCMSIGKLDNPQLHMFCDASKDAYAAVVYLRTNNGDGTQVQLIQAKTRVAPKKKCTIPRLELLGCTIGSRLIQGIKTSLPDDTPIYYWTDSSTALAWIKKNENWGVFVRNRVVEINNITNVNSWRHVPGELNPADLPSRGCSPAELYKLRWWEGPAWLRKPSQYWPNCEVQYDKDKINAEKMKSSQLNMINSEEPFPFLKFSKYWSNVKMLGWILRFVKKCQKSAEVQSDVSLSFGEIQDAELKMLQLVQKSGFQKVGGHVNGIRIFNQHGLIKVKSKLLNRQDSEIFRTPILLPKSHPIVRQLIEDYHNQYCHGGVQFLMSKLRERFWILKARQIIKKIEGACVKCRRFQSKPIHSEDVALPLDRVSDCKAFQVTGLDLAGPLFLKGKSKVWIVIFTCAVYRAVHLELVKSLTTEDFILALTRFISRRGRPLSIYSDNGTNLAGTANLFSSLDWTKIENFAKVKAIKWKFNPPTAAWWGGFWERLIRSLKDILKRMLGNGKLNYVQLETCLCEAESVMNARPLTYVTEDPEDLIPLTPSMFIQDNFQVQVPELEEMDSSQLRKQFEKIKILRQELRGRFRNEYLGILLQKSKDKKEEPVKVGEIVLVGSDNKKRLEWPLAKVEELISGKDGVVRVVWIRTANGGRMLRPIQRLYRLESPETNSRSKTKDAQPITAIISNTGLVITLSTQFYD